MAGAIPVMFNDFSIDEADDWRESEESVARTASAYMREHKSFATLTEAIRAGTLFPTVAQLLDGHPPFRDSLVDDIAVWVARSRQLAGIPEALRDDLRDFETWPSPEGIVRVYDGASAIPQNGYDDSGTDAIVERSAWYGAVLGVPRLKRKLFASRRDVDHRRLAYRFGLEFSADHLGSARQWTQRYQEDISAQGHLMLRRVAVAVEVVDWMSDHHQDVVKFTKGKMQRPALFALATPTAAAATPTSDPTVVDAPEATPRQDEEKQVERDTVETIDSLLGQPKMTVIPKIEVAGTSDQKAFMGQFAKLTMVRVPLVVAPDVAAIARDLTSLWPHAEAVIRRILSDVVPGQPVRLRPTLLVGDPGSGKTRLLGALTRHLGLASVVFPCASVADGSFGGTPAQWSSRRASVPLELIRSSKTANPCVILDELEKTGKSSQNGSLLHALLPMLERHSAESYFETALETNVNLSAVSFLATANSLDAIPDPLKDRFRVVVMPNPGLEHLDSLVDGIALDVHEDRGIPTRFFEALAPDEIEVVGRAWGGGSLRKLRQAVETAIDHRDRSRTMQ